jgi:hypothetical protein
VNVLPGVLSALFLLIMVRQIGHVRLQIWQMMVGDSIDLPEARQNGTDRILYRPVLT